MRLNDIQRQEWEKRDNLKRRAYNNRMEQRQLARRKAGMERKGEGIDKPGFNFELGEYIENTSDLKQKFNKKRRTDPRFKRLDSNM